MKRNENPFRTDGHAENKRELYFGSFILKTVERTLLRDGLTVSLTSKEFEILRVLIEGHGQHFSNEILLTLIWQDTTVDPNNVAQLITRLRKKMGKDAAGRDYILNSPGVGYVFAAVVSNLPSGPSQGCPSTEQTDSGSVKPLTCVEPVVGPEADGGHPSTGMADAGFPSIFNGTTHETAHLAATERILKLPPKLQVYVAATFIALLLLIFFLQARPQILLATQYTPLTDDGLPKRGPLLFDGNRVWFQESLNGDWKVVSVVTSGGDVVPFEIPLKDVQLLDVAADGSALLVSARDATGSNLWSWPLLGGAPQLLPPKTGAAGWAPDKSAIAFGDFGALLIVPGNGLTKSTIAFPADKRVLNPRWAPDGAHLSFGLSNLKSSLQTLWLCDRAGRGMHPFALAQGTGEDQLGGTWTRDGRYFIFAAGTAVRHDLWAIPGRENFLNTHIGRAYRLTNGPLAWDAPAPGKSTSEIYALGESLRAELVSLPPEGGWRPYLGGASAYELDFSRDDKWVTYTRYPDHTIWKARHDGTDRVQLTSADMEAHQPHWSPDGGEIAFMAQRPGRRWRVMIINIATGAVQEPIAQGDDQGVPTWSADGRLIMYGEWKYTKGLNGMKIHLIDREKRTTTTMEGSEGLWTPRWSPDGAYIAALRQDSKALLVVQRGSRQWRQIVVGEELDDPTWSVDSKYVYLTEQSRRKLLRVRAADGIIENRLELQDFPLPRESWFGVAPGGSPLGLRARRQEVYSLTWASP